MLEALITSKTRIKLLTKFFLNPDSQSYLRGLAEEFGESSNAIRVELNRFEEAGLLQTESVGNKKMFRANKSHPLFKDLHRMVKKTMGIDKIVENVIQQLGKVDQAYLIGDFARGKNSPTVDVLLIGDHLNMTYLVELIGKAEKLIAKKIRYLILNKSEADNYLMQVSDKMLIWNKQ